MVGLVLVGHSARLLDGLRAMVAQSAPDVPVHVAGGTSAGRLGTSGPLVLAALRAALAATGDSGVLVLLDLGSAGLALEVALDDLSPDERDRVVVSDAPIVEGAVLAGVEAAAGSDLAAVAAAAHAAIGARKLPSDWTRPAPGPGLDR